MIILMKQFSGLHHEFVASALITELAHEIDENNKVGAMLAYFTISHTCAPEDVLAAQQKDQMRNLFLFDVLLRGKYPYYIDSLLNGWKIKMSRKT